MDIQRRFSTDQEEKYDCIVDEVTCDKFTKTVEDFRFCS